MMKNSKVVYSTNPDYAPDETDRVEPTTLPPHEQKLRIITEKKGRRGKVVTVIRGFVGADSDMKALSKSLKCQCGVGGTVKNGDILIQGNFRDKIVGILAGLGYRVK